MNRYYFHEVSEHHKQEISDNIINIKLVALYAEKVFSAKHGKEQYRFNYFDTVKAYVAPNDNGSCRFELESGKDLATGHWAKSLSELVADKEESGYKLIAEEDYFSLRKQAITLLFRHTNFNTIASDENKFTWGNSSNPFFYDIRLVNVAYKLNRKGYDEKFLNYLKNQSLSLYDVSVPEEIRIFIAKPTKDEKPQHCCRFHIYTNDNYGRYPSFEDAHKSIYGRNDFSELTVQQYERIRKICKYLMFEYCDLDITALKHKQNYSVRMLDF